MPKPRLAANKPLPRRWRFLHGAYYYRVPPGLEHLWDGKKQFRLGGTLAEAAEVWGKRADPQRVVRTVGELLDRYELEVVPTKGVTTQAGNRIQIRRLRRAFSAAGIGEITPRHVYQYVDLRTKKIAAHREIEVLSHAFTKAVEWGYLDRHPFKGEVRLKGEKPRDRYVTDAEVLACLALPSKRKAGSVRALQAYIRLKLLTGLRRGDLLRLRLADCQDDGIHVRPHKTQSSGKTVIYTWNEDLRAAVDMAKAARPITSLIWLFCTRRGEGYVNEKTGEANGFDSMWGRFVDRLLAEGKITERFTEHDLRAKVGSDAESLERARALLAHAPGSTVTDRVYRRAPERVAPARGPGKAS